MDAERILVTGAAGYIGSILRSSLARPGRVLRLFDKKGLKATSPDEEVVRASITNLTDVERAAAGVVAIVHLAGLAHEGPWEDILQTNIQGTFSVFEAARKQRVPRVVIASSNHAVGFYPVADFPAPDYLFPTPDTYYGVGMVTAEAIASLYHNRYGIEAVCLRIMTCRAEPGSRRDLSTWLSPNDTGRLFEASLTVANPGFRVAWGVSANQRSVVSLSEARSLGFDPLDDAEVFAPQILIDDPAPVSGPDDWKFLGGPLCSERFDADNLRSGSRYRADRPMWTRAARGLWRRLQRR